MIFLFLSHVTEVTLAHYFYISTFVINEDCSGHDCFCPALETLLELNTCHFMQHRGMGEKGIGDGGVDGCLLLDIHCKDKGRLSPFVSFLLPECNMMQNPLVFNELYLYRAHFIMYAIFWRFD